MKVFFTASLGGTETLKNDYSTIYKAIEKLGYTHLDKEIFELSGNKFYKEIEKEGKEGYKELYSRKISHVKSADICIYECSVKSLSIGYLIEKSLQLNKPTIVLYKNENIPHFVVGIEDEKLIVESYNETNIESVLHKALSDARERRDKRFNFFISPKLLEYLEETSKTENVTKSKLIRSFIVEHMKKNKKE